MDQVTRAIINVPHRVLDLDFFLDEVRHRSKQCQSEAKYDWNRDDVRRFLDQQCVGRAGSTTLWVELLRATINSFHRELNEFAMPSQLMQRIFLVLYQMHQIAVGRGTGAVQPTIALVGFAMVAGILLTSCSRAVQDVKEPPKGAAESKPVDGKVQSAMPAEKEPLATTGDGGQAGGGFAEIMKGMDSRRVELDRVTRDRKACESQVAQRGRNDPALQQRLAALTTRERELKLDLVVDKSYLGLEKALELKLDVQPANLGDLASRIEGFQRQLDAYGKELDVAKKECEEAAGQLGQRNRAVLRAREVLSVCETAWRPVRDRMFAAEERAKGMESADQEKIKKALLELKQRPEIPTAKPRSPGNEGNR